MKISHLEAIDRVKAQFLKLALGLPRNARNRLTLALAGTTSFIEDLVKRFSLPETEALKQFRSKLADKHREIDESFNLTPAMRNGPWKACLREDRHLTTRYAIHGFHHNAALPSSLRKLSLQTCGDQCTTYHLQICTAKPSIRSLVR